MKTEGGKVFIQSPPVACTPTGVTPCLRDMPTYEGSKNQLYKLLFGFIVIHCPNSCFHNGDCIGATCFCYPGWTGEDCSKFHCYDLHNCSGKGECMGPNVCKCYPGYLVSAFLFNFIVALNCVDYSKFDT